MDKCPQEIYDHIVSFVERRVGEADVPFSERRTLPSTYPVIAAVSHKFQAAIERQTFHCLHVDTTKDDLDQFEHILTPRRRNILRHLSLYIVLPSYPEELWSEFETDEDRRANNESATATIGRAFRILAGNDSQNDDSVRPVLTLEILHVYSPSDMRCEQENYRARYAFSPLDLTSEVSEFPPLPCVRSFRIRRMTRRAWNPRVAMPLTAKMVRATDVCWSFSYLQEGIEDWSPYHSLDRMFRDGLVDSIKSAELPASVTSFHCDLISPDTRRYHKLPRFVAPGEYDPVSCALRRLTRNCTKVVIDGPVHVSLFDPPAGAPGASQPCWQDTTELRVNARMRAPDGNWLFGLESGRGTPNGPDTPTDLDQLPPGYGTTEEEREEAYWYYCEHLGILASLLDHSRNHPKDAEMNALLAAFARACSRMPALQMATLIAEDEDNDGVFQVTCTAPGRSGSWSVFLYVDDWRPAESTMEEFSRMGRVGNGEDRVVYFFP